MPDSLRIALLTYSTKPRGSVVHTLELARSLHQLGHQPCVFALDKDGQGFGRSFPFATQAVPAKPCDGDLEDLIRQRITEFVKFLAATDQSFDIFHAQDCIGANALAQLRAAGKISHFVRTVHHIEAFESPYLLECQDRSIHLPDRCFCVSQVWQEALKRDYEIEAVRVFNGVNRECFTPVPTGQESALADLLGIQGKPVYLTVGGIEPRKNSIRILQAFAQVLAVHPQAQLVIAGGSTLFNYQSYREAFWQAAEEVGIQPGKSLCLPGVISDADLPTLYRLADAFVFPSLKEGWGLVVLEAIASGLPVITSQQQPFTEFLTPEQALLVDPESVDAIATALLQVVQPNLRQRLIECSQTVCPRYTWEASAQIHINAYTQLLSTGVC